MNNYRLTFLIIFCWFPIFVLSQNEKIDDLRTKLDTISNTEEKAKVLGDLSYFFRGISLDSSLVYAKKELAFSKSIQNDWGLFDAHLNIGSCYLIQNDLKKGELWLKKSLAIADSLKVTKYQAAANANLGSLYYSQQEYSKAVRNFYTALELEKANQDSLKIAKSYNNLCVVYSAQAKYDDAFQMANKALEIFEIYNDSTNIALVKMNIGINHRKENNYDKALPLLLESLTILEELEVYWRLSSIYMNTGICLEELERYQESEPYYDKAMSAAKFIGDKKIYCKSILNKGSLYLKTKRFKEAETLLQEGLDSTVVIEGALELKHLGYKMLYDLYKEQKKYKQALEALERKDEAEDSLFNETKNLQIQTLIVEHQTEQQKDSIALLQANQIIDDKKIQQQQVINYSLLGMLFAVIAILGLLYNRFSLKKKQNIEIREKNELLSTQKDQIEILNEEINHRVKNNLQLIFSLMEMQNRRLENDEAKSALQESENRIKAMALIHEKLYHQNENQRINLSDYLKELIEYLEKFYKGDFKQLSIHAELDDVTIEAEPAIHIGLILNELVTNGFKHAFPKGYDPTINIQLKRVANDAIQLIYSDKGQGFVENRDTNKLESLGIKLIKIITKQLDGNYDIINEKGVTFKFDFDLGKLSKN